MNEKDYNTWLKEAKAALDSYSASRQEIASLYRQAKENAKAEYLAQKEQLEKETKRSMNQAATENMKLHRDIDRTLASRGLAFSGENAQTDVDMALNLRGRLAELEDQRTERASALDTGYADTAYQMDLAYAKENSEAAEKLTDMKMAMASAVKNAQDTKEEAVPNGETGAEIPQPDLKGKSFSQKVKLLAQHAKEVQAAKDKASQFTPEISAKELAKQLVSAVGKDGVIGSISQQEALEKALNRLTEANHLSEPYLQELMLNLSSLGYRPDYREDEAYGLEDLQKRSYEAYDQYYDRYYHMYRSAGYDAKQSDGFAGKKALFMQFVYLYTNSRNKEVFENAMSALGYRNELEEFYKEIQKDPHQYGLGSALNPS